ncbi:MAG: hypothetical protein ACYCZX_19650 [Rhodospirillaceae bacterium]
MPKAFMSLLRWAAVFAASCLPGLAMAAPNPCDRSLAGKIPARPADEPGGKDFTRRTAAMSESEREAAIGAELLAGNIPRFLRQPVAVDLVNPSTKTPNQPRVTICVLPDYLAVGSDDDFMFTPMRLETALMVAHRYGFVLPTRHMVDAIYAQSAIHLTPQPLPPGDGMRSNEYYWHHNQMIGAQRASLGAPLGVLTAGHKKDLVLTNRLWRDIDKVAIYGWHLDRQTPIQPLTTVHGAHYADYSHGVRLVSAKLYVDGREESIDEALEDRKLAAILSDEGPIPHVEQLIATLDSFDARKSRTSSR